MNKKSFIPKIFHFGFKLFNESGKLELNKFIIFLVLSVVVWYISRVIQALVEVFVFKNSSISLYSTSISETGYPIAQNISQTDNIYYLICAINIILWFIILFGIWKLAGKLLKK
ncbi:MAG: hypothetical protein Q7R97_04395 [Candidatus Daviesbacteria bacterium]|nr:hypothetical protein [Candidatus Daviesbacteria bacterium]